MPGASPPGCLAALRPLGCGFGTPEPSASSCCSGEEDTPDEYDDGLASLLEEDDFREAAARAERLRVQDEARHGETTDDRRGDFAEQTGMTLTQCQYVPPTPPDTPPDPAPEATPLAPATATATSIKFWGIQLRKNGTIRSTFYVFWSDETSTYETYRALIKWKCTPAFLAHVKKKTWRGKPTPFGVGARRCLRPTTSAKKVSRAVAGVVVGSCCCVGLGSAGRCFGSCLPAGTSVPWSLRETTVSSSSLPVQRPTAGATPAATVGASKPLAHQDTGGWCVLYALLNACHHALHRPIPKELQAALRVNLGPVSDLKKLSVALLSLRKKSPVGLRRIKTKTLAGATPLQWVLRQNTGLFLVADYAHCVAVDCRRQRVYDCAEGFPLALSFDVLSRQCGIDVQSGLVEVRAVHSR
jgi:hypothetical protein